MLKTPDKNIKLVPGGFISKDIMYSANQGELCIIGDESDFTVEPSIEIVPLPEGVDS